MRFYVVNFAINRWKHAASYQFVFNMQQVTVHDHHQSAINHCQLQGNFPRESH